MPAKLPAITVEALLNRYRDGEKVHYIAVCLGITPTAVCQHARKAGLKRRNQRGPRITQEQRAMILTLYRAGVKVRSIAQVAGCNQDTVCTYAHLAGLRRRTNGQLRTQ